MFNRTPIWRTFLPNGDRQYNTILIGLLASIALTVVYIAIYLFSNVGLHEAELTLLMLVLAYVVARLGYPYTALVIQAIAFAEPIVTVTVFGGTTIETVVALHWLLHGALVIGLTLLSTYRDRRVTLLEAAIQQAPDGVIVTRTTDDGAPRIVFANDRVQYLTGYQPKPDALISPDLHKLLSTNGRTSVADAHQMTLQTPEAGRVTIEWTHKPVGEVDRKPVHHVAILRDVTARTQALEDLRRSEARFAALFRSSPTMLLLVDTHDGRVVDANVAFLRWSGIERERLLGRTYAEVGVHLAEADVQAMASELAEKGRIVQYECDYTKVDGTVARVLTSCEPIEIDGEQLLLSQTDDITLLRRAQTARTASEQFLAEVFALVPVGVCLLDADGYIRKVNERYCHIYGYTQAELIDTHYSKLLLPSDVEAWTASHADFVATGNYNRLLRKMPRKDGGHIIVNITTSRMVLPTNGVHVILAAEDQTQHFHAEEELQRYAQQQAVLAELGQEALTSDNLDELIDGIVWLLGSVLHVDCAKVLELLPDKSALLVRAGTGWQPGIVGQATVGIDGDSQAGYTLLTNDPVVVADLSTETRFSGPEMLTSHDVISGVSVVVHGPDGPYGVIGVYTRTAREFSEDDVNFVAAVATLLGVFVQRHQALETLRDLNNELEARVRDRTLQIRTMLDSTGEGIFYTEGENFAYVNRALCVITGYEVDELLNQPVSTLRPKNIDEENDSLLLAINREVVIGRVWRGEVRLARKNGLVFDAGLTVARVGEDDEEPVRSITVLRDITQQKAHEEQQARFIATASHELRTPITNLSTRLYLMERKPEDLDRHLQVLKDVERRLRTLVENLLDVSNYNEGTMRIVRTMVDPNEVVQSVLALQRQEAAIRELEIGCTYDPEAPNTYADRERLVQVVTNLVNNAINYTNAGGEIHIATAVAYHEGRDWIVLTVKDTGIGIAHQHIAHIFQPFYRADIHETIKGNGLGLSITKEIVELHDGHIEVESTVGEGTTFRVWLPVMAAP